MFDAAAMVNSINGSCVSADIDLVVLGCKMLINDLEFASVTHVRRELNAESS